MQKNNCLMSSLVLLICAVASAQDRRQVAEPALPDRIPGLHRTTAGFKQNQLLRCTACYMTYRKPHGLRHLRSMMLKCLSIAARSNGQEKSESPTSSKVRYQCSGIPA